MAVIQVTVCDVCRDPGRSVEHYTVTVGDRKGETVRCGEHGRAFAEVVAGATKPAKATWTPSATRKGRPSRPTSTLDEIEALRSGDSDTPPAGKSQGRKAARAKQG